MVFAQMPVVRSEAEVSMLWACQSVCFASARPGTRQRTGCREAWPFGRLSQAWLLRVRRACERGSGRLKTRHGGGAGYSSMVCGAETMRATEEAEAASMRVFR